MENKPWEIITEEQVKKLFGRMKNLAFMPIYKDPELLKQLHDEINEIAVNNAKKGLTYVPDTEGPFKTSSAICDDKEDLDDSVKGGFGGTSLHEALVFSRPIEIKEKKCDLDHKTVLFMRKLLTKMMGTSDKDINEHSFLCPECKRELKND